MYANNTLLSSALGYQNLIIITRLVFSIFQLLGKKVPISSGKNVVWSILPYILGTLVGEIDCICHPTKSKDALLVTLMLNLHAKYLMLNLHPMTAV